MWGWRPNQQQLLKKKETGKRKQEKDSEEACHLYIKYINHSFFFCCKRIFSKKVTNLQNQKNFSELEKDPLSYSFIKKKEKEKPNSTLLMISPNSYTPLLFEGPTSSTFPP